MSSRGQRVLRRRAPGRFGPMARGVLLLLGGVLLAAALAALVIRYGLETPRFDEAAWARQVAAQDPAALYAPHRGPQGRFFNPWLPRGHSSWRVLRWWLAPNSLPRLRGRFPPAPRVTNRGGYLHDPAAPDSLTWIGHATYAIQLGGQVVLTDPFFSSRALVVSRLVPPAMAIEELPRRLLVLISHNHYDHLDASSVRALAARGAEFICPLGLGAYLRELGARRVTELDWWQSRRRRGLAITFLPTQHWSRRWGQGYDRTLWGSFLIQGHGRKVFYGGDSGYFAGFREFGRRFGPVDAALIGAGAYAPRWFMHYAHLDPRELVRAAKDLQARLVVPTQWGVLKLGDEPASYPAVVLRRLAGRDPWLRKRLRLLPVGGRLLLGAPAGPAGAGRLDSRD